MDTINNNTQPANLEPVAPSAPEDIVTRVTQAVDTPEATETPSEGGGDTFSNLEKSIEEPLITQEQLDRIKDPIEKQRIMEIEKEMRKGMNKKFQDTAELRKSLEEKEQQLSQNKPKWDISTIEGLRQASNDPDFASLVQQYAREVAPPEWQGSQDDWSGLSESDKSEFSSMKQEINNLKQTNIRGEITRIDSQLKDKYASYSPTVIDNFIGDINAGKLTTSELRELIHCAKDYKAGIKRAYNMGLKEQHLDMSSKMNATSFDTTGRRVEMQGDMPVRQKGESSKNYFSRYGKSLLDKQRLKTGT